jgi:hypothetical protein
MQCMEAMTFLGLTSSQIQDEAAIRQAWAQTKTQTNEAKKVLLKKLAKDMTAREREKPELEVCEQTTHGKKKRTPETRVHRKIESYQEGRELIDEMNKCFREHLVLDPVEKHETLVRDILNLFVVSRNSTTELEKNLFKCHNKKLILAVFPGAVYSTYKNQRCFCHLKFRE